MNVSGTLLLGIASIFLALGIALIPLIARRPITGDVGSTMGTALRGAGIAVGGATRIVAD